MHDLKNKVILVVGGRGYLGRDFCNKLKQYKATVISADLKENSRAVVNSRAKVDTSGIKQVNIDVTSKKSVIKVVDKILKEFKRIDVLVFSVTNKPNDFYKPYTECSLKGWQKVIKTELDGVFLITQKVGEIMETQKKGSIILLSSIYGVVGNDQRIYNGSNLEDLYLKDSKKKVKTKIYSHSVYSTVKGGIISLTKYLAAYWGEKNIRVNCISPGGIFHPSENRKFVKKYSKRTPLGRKAKLSEISPMVVFLSSNESNYITGQNIIIDGGWTSW